MRQENTMHVEDVIEIFNWMGKQKDALPINKAYLDADVLEFEGKLFQHPVKGTITFMDDYVVQIFLTDAIENYQDTTNQLITIYGKPYATGEEPYVEANGGVVFWQYFYTGKGIIALSYGEEHSFYSLRYKRKDEAPIEVRQTNTKL